MQKNQSTEETLGAFWYNKQPYSLIRNRQLSAIFSGRDSFYFLEGLDKIAQIRKARGKGNVGDRQIRDAQFARRLFYAVFVQIFYRCFARHVLEKCPKIFWRFLYGVGKHFQCNGLIVILPQKGKDRFQHGYAFIVGRNAASNVRCVLLLLIYRGEKVVKSGYNQKFLRSAATFYGFKYGVERVMTSARGGGEILVDPALAVNDVFYKGK